jgi:serine/threonine protein kinase
MQPLQPGDPDEVGGYRIRGRLGRGGMGRVYLASTQGGRLVALKVIRAELIEDGEYRERFRQEVRAARRVRGLYTAELLDADPDVTPPWLVTAYVSGPSLSETVKDQGPVPAELVPLLIGGVAEALLDIHSAGIVHRDLKASNVLLSPDGPRVIDFGIARALDNGTLTNSGVTMGSPESMSPEQVRGLPVTPAADVFALGSLGAYATFGRSPFEADNSAAMMFRVVQDAPDLEGCPAELRSLLESCLDKDPAARPSPVEVLALCRKLMPDEPAVFPQSWAPVPGSQASQPAWPGSPAAPGIPRPPSLDHNPVPAYTPPLHYSKTPPDKRTSTLYHPRPGETPAQATSGLAAQAATWLTYGACALAVAALVTGLATLPSVRTMFVQQHPGAAPAAISTAVNTAAAIIGIRALASIGTWLWAARDASQDRRRAKIATIVALAVSTLGLASTHLQTPAASPVRLLSLASWILGLGAVVFVWSRRKREQT